MRFDKVLTQANNNSYRKQRINATFETSLAFKLAQLRHYANNSLAFYNKIWTLTF
jgi:hypothetical protein